MKKKIYEKPEMTVVELHYRASLLQASETLPNDAPEFDDYLG